MPVPQKSGMAKWLLWEMAKVGVNQRTSTGTSHVPGSELKTQKRIYCPFVLEADRTYTHKGNRSANSGFLINLMQATVNL